jgi:hypothetical protein
MSMFNRYQRPARNREEAWILTKHDQEVKKVLMETGCMDEKGRMMRWKGEQSRKVMLPHTSISPWECQCWKDVVDKEVNSIISKKEKKR